MSLKHKTNQTSYKYIQLQKMNQTKRQNDQMNEKELQKTME